MPDSRPTVSVGMPVYNGGPFLEDTLRSLLAQSFRDFELIISDNASTDRTEAVCRELAARDERVRYRRGPVNLGAARNYNRVVKMAAGRYFKWAAADDLCAPDYLQKCVEVLDARPDVVLAYPRTVVIDAEGKEIETYDDDLGLPEPRPRDRFRKAVKSVRECNAVFGLIRTDVLRRTARIGNYMGSDVVLLGELTLYGKFEEIPDRLFFRRDHARASSADKSLESQQEFFDPSTRGAMHFHYWRHLRGYLGAVRRAPLQFSEKAVLAGIVTRRAIRLRKHLLDELFIPARRLARRV